MKNKGFVTTYVLVFGSLLLVMLGGVFGFILFELRRGKHEVAWHRSLQVAEASIGRYQWCLNNGVEDQCTGQFSYYDLSGNEIGASSVSADPEMSCEEEGLHYLVVSGWDTDFPEETREVRASLGRISVARYAYLIDDNVWAGSDREIRGLYHVNGGVRMDGENQSLVTSAQEDWLCTSSFGCDYWDCPSDCVQDGYACRCPGVFTTTDNSSSDLFEYPVTHFDFGGISIDLGRVKNITLAYPQNKYWPPVTNIDGSGEGYHLVFNNSGQVEVWIITDLDPTYGYSDDDGWHDDYFSIVGEYLYKTIDIDSSCSLIFVEDDVWVEGELEGQLTVVSADLISSTNETTVVLPDDITYVQGGTDDGLGLISEGSVLISPDSPEVMELEGVFVAQKGHFGRNLYWWNTKDKLEISGSIVSKGRVGTRWSSGSVFVSGYSKRESYVDTDLIHNPPAFIPSVSDDFQIFDWEETE